MHFYLRKKGTTPHLGTHKHSMEYDGRLDWYLWVQAGMWNIGSLSGNGGRANEELTNRMIDVLFAGEIERTGF